MPHRQDAIAQAERTARDWLGQVRTELGTEDRDFAYRALRAWLHVVRDRLSVHSAAHLAAQLPTLLRGLYFEGWRPNRVPAEFDGEEFQRRFAIEADIEIGDVDRVAVAVTTALGDRFSPGQLGHALAVFPASVRAKLTGQPAVRDEHLDDTRLADLEASVTRLYEAVTELAGGIAGSPMDEPLDEHVAKAAKAAHRLLLAAGGSTRSR
ncbi:DUF2267 domain-containing protein [Amycolatopsis sp. CA-230715]|uniref:DUF2267 domain-containing protein n=1 Tax=Amycolatopsis sp. CA-230715 TaxID=2745196 RepID=UPI001C033D80|nr:DUF2267 domain-containing protein [Amycolatopsis sp. CA-230715]QWF77970.1 hypothetical protein HUW46_01363 [Amycolatopsis sp. CA-230715]